MQALIPTVAVHYMTVQGPLIRSGQHLSGGEIKSTNNEQPGEFNPAKTNRKPRALVVDDAPDVTEMLGVLLQYAGYDVVKHFAAPDAVEAALSEQFDVVVSDIGMPGMNGYELASTLRALPNYHHVPMIAVTGFTMYSDRDRALQSGFNAFLTKPINPMDLIQLIERLRG